MKYSRRYLILYRESCIEEQKLVKKWREGGWTPDFSLTDLLTSHANSNCVVGRDRITKSERLNLIPRLRSAPRG